MKQTIHPEFHTNAKITCTACKAVFLIAGTVKDQQTEICSNCHPIYTGKYRSVAASGRVERFQKKLAAAAKAPPKVQKKKMEPEEKLEKKLQAAREEKKKHTAPAAKKAPAKKAKK